MSATQTYLPYVAFNEPLECGQIVEVMGRMYAIGEPVTREFFIANMLARRMPPDEFIYCYAVEPVV